MFGARSPLRARKLIVVMPKVYLLGGENVFRRTARNVNARAFQDGGSPLNVLVFPWARASFDRRYWKRKRLFDYFLSLGASNVNFVEYADQTDDIAQKMATASLIYLTGGLPTILIERLRNMKIDRMLKNYTGVVVGRSAGALALSRKCIITCRGTSKVKMVNGIDIVNLTLKVHYKPEHDPILQHLSKQEPIYAIPEASAVVCENDYLSSINTVYLFENGNKQTLIQRNIPRT
jgi:dipeptidase E